MNLIYEMLKSHFRAVRYRWWVLLSDLLMIPIAWMLAYWMYGYKPEYPELYPVSGTIIYNGQPLVGAAVPAESIRTMPYDNS